MNKIGFYSKELQEFILCDDAVWKKDKKPKPTVAATNNRVIIPNFSQNDQNQNNQQNHQQNNQNQQNRQQQQHGQEQNPQKNDHYVPPQETDQTFFFFLLKKEMI